jgi:hypothetical protein
MQAIHLALSGWQKAVHVQIKAAEEQLIKKRLNKTSTRAYTNTQTYEQTHEQSYEQSQLKQTLREASPASQ